MKISFSGLGLGSRKSRSGNFSAPTEVPSNTGSLPSFSAIETAGETWTASRGGWTPGPITADEWQHQVSDDGSTGWADISGATNQAFTPDATFETKYVRAGAKPSNAFGQAADFAYGAAVGPIAAELTLTGTPDDATVDAPYSWTPVTDGGHGPYTYASTGTTLPVEWDLDTATGELSAATVPDNGNLTGVEITVTDGDGLTAALGPFSVTVNASGGAPVVQGAPVLNMPVNLMYPPTVTPGAYDVTPDSYSRQIQRWNGASYDDVGAPFSGTNAGLLDYTTDIAVNMRVVEVATKGGIDSADNPSAATQMPGPITSQVTGLPARPSLVTNQFQAV